MCTFLYRKIFLFYMHTHLEEYTLKCYIVYLWGDDERGVWGTLTPHDIFFSKFAFFLNKHALVLHFPPTIKTIRILKNHTLSSFQDHQIVITRPLLSDLFIIMLICPSTSSPWTESKKLAFFSTYKLPGLYVQTTFKAFQPKERKQWEYYFPSIYHIIQVKRLGIVFLGP